MGTIGECRTSRRVLSILALSGLAAGMIGIVASTAGAVVPTCQVRNVNAALDYTDLQAAVNAANPGDTVRVRGVCFGNFSIDKDLTLVGRSTQTVKKATLDGGNVGIVVSVSSAVVSFKDLLITHGNASDAGGGISNDGGNVTLRGRAQVSGNTAFYNGGGIVNFHDSTLTLNGSAQVNGNTVTFPPQGLGGGIYSAGTLTLNGSAQVNHNAGAYGGGIYNDGTLTLNGSAQVNGNTVTYDGGGIYIGSGTVILHDSSRVNRNAASGVGGGIYVGGGGGTLSGATAGVNVKLNNPDDIAP